MNGIPGQAPCAPKGPIVVLMRPHPHTCARCETTFGCTEPAWCPELCGPCQQDAWAEVEAEGDDWEDAQVVVADERAEHEACERGTVGCCVAHALSVDHGCETW